MKVSVDRELCIGCGLCASSCPDVFEMQENVAVSLQASVAEGQADDVRRAAQECPVEAIKVGE